MAIHKIGGVSTVGGGTCDELKMDGVITCNGDIQARSIDLDGVVTINGKMSGDEWIKVNGVVTISDAMRSKTVSVDGVCTIKGNIEADHVNIKGVVSSKKQISADLVDGRGMISAEEIVGEKVIVRCGHNRRHLFDMFKERELPKIGLIEATEIEVEGIHCQNLNGHNIVIGPQCIVENVDCSGTLSIAPEAQVQNINGQPRGSVGC